MFGIFRSSHSSSSQLNVLNSSPSPRRQTIVVAVYSPPYQLEDRYNEVGVVVDIQHAATALVSEE